MTCPHTRSSRACRRGGRGGFACAGNGLDRRSESGSLVRVARAAIKSCLRRHDEVGREGRSTRFGSRYSFHPRGGQAVETAERSLLLALLAVGLKCRGNEVNIPPLSNQPLLASS